MNLAVTLLLASLVGATPMQPRLLPEWEQLTIEGEQRACYDLDDARQLLVLEEECRFHRTTNVTLRAQIDDLERLQLNTTEQLERNAAIEVMQNARIAELVDQLNEEIEAKNRWRAEADTIDVWPLALGGGALLLSVGIVVGALIGGLLE